MNIVRRSASLQILVDCTWALAYLLDCGNQMIQIIVESDLVPYIVKLLNHNEIKIVTAGKKMNGGLFFPAIQF